MVELSHSLEDYLEAVYRVSRKKKAVRVKDLVKELNVKSASVIGALKKLESKGLVEHEHYGYVDMTPNGRKKAAGIYEKHRTLFRFLTEVLDVDREIAEKDACLIEHYISDETYEKLIKLIRFIESDPEGTSPWLEDMRNGLKTGRKS